MRRRTGAIFRETRPETIITSACLGDARNTSEPNRAKSLRPLVAFIISIAQQARPKVAGHRADLRAQLMSESSRVVKISGSASAMTCSSPIIVWRKLVPCAVLLSCARAPARLFSHFEQAGFCFGLAPGAFSPIQSAFLDYINKTCGQQYYENDHFKEDDIAQTVFRAGQPFERHCPGHQKDDFNIEQDKEHSDQIKLNRESFARRSDRILSAFIRH